MGIRLWSTYLPETQIGALPFAKLGVCVEVSGVYRSTNDSCKVLSCTLEDLGIASLQRWGLERQSRPELTHINTHRRLDGIYVDSFVVRVF